MSNRKTLDERIEAAKLEKEQAENRIKELLKEQKEAERKARNHRLCSRGGIIEKGLPDLIKLTDEQFEVFVKKSLLSGYAARVIRELLPPEPAAGQDSDADAPQTGGAAAGRPDSGDAHPHSAPSPNPANITNHVGAHSGGKPFSGNAQTNAAPVLEPSQTAQGGTVSAANQTAQARKTAS